MKNKLFSLQSTFSVNGVVSNEDTRFMNVTIDVLHTGLNKNRSVFTKDVVDASIDSIKNTPVLGFIEYAPEDMDFEGHEHVLVKTEDGIEQKYLGSAFGVIPESCNPRWFTKTCSDGEEREFLQVDALLWNKFSDSSSIMIRDIEKSQSMELEISSVDGYEDEDGIFHFEKFRFDGCCILGEDVMPAMVDANVKLQTQFEVKEFISSIQDELNDKFTSFSNLVDDMKNQGGVGDMPNTDFSLTLLQKFEEVSKAVAQYETVTDCWGDAVPRYYAVDIQGEEVIAVDAANGYSYFGFTCSEDGDAIKVNFESPVRKKLVYSDFEGGEEPIVNAFSFSDFIDSISGVALEKVGAANLEVADFEAKVAEATEKIASLEEEAASKASEFEAQVAEFETAKASMEEELASLKSEYEEIKVKYDEFVEAEEKRKADEISASKDAVFAEFEELLGDNADFLAIKEMKEELSVEEIEGKCAILYVKNVAGKNNFSHAGSSTALGILDGDDNSEGFASTKYGNIPINR